MKIAVVGAGAVGGFLAARLGAVGTDVALLARGAHLAAIRASGLRLESEAGDVTFRPRVASRSAADIGPVDLVLCAVKIYDLETAADGIGPLIGPETGVVTLQNGIDAPVMLEHRLGREHVVGGVANIAAVLAEPGLIRITGTMARFVFGELDHRRSPRLAALSDALAAADVEHEITGDIRRAIWAKMVFLASFSGVTAVIRLPIGPIRDDPDTRALLRSTLEEALAVAAADGCDFGPDAVEERLTAIDRLPFAMRSSLLDDLERGRRLETPWLSGTIARLGRRYGIPTPTHDLITTVLKPHLSGRPQALA